MSAKRKITKTCLLVLGSNPEPEQWSVWKQLAQLANVFGEGKVCELFDEWAEIHKGDEFPSGPVSEFMKTAPGLCTGVYQIKPKGALVDLLNDLVEIANGRVIFNRNQQAAISRLMVQHTPEEIKSIFTEFWRNIETDDFSVRGASKNFTESAEQLLELRKRRKIEAVKQDAIFQEAMKVGPPKARADLEPEIKGAI